jgi:hypothetical protein
MLNVLDNFVIALIVDYRLVSEIEFRWGLANFEYYSFSDCILFKEKKPNTPVVDKNQSIGG